MPSGARTEIAPRKGEEAADEEEEFSKRKINFLSISLWHGKTRPAKEKNVVSAF